MLATPRWARTHEIIPASRARFADEKTEAWRVKASREGRTNGPADSQPRAPSLSARGLGDGRRAPRSPALRPPGGAQGPSPPRACALTQAGRWPRGPQSPGRRPEGGEAAQAEVGDAEAHDGRLVQLARDGSGQREQLGQLEELQVLLSAPRARRVPGLLLALRLQAGRAARRGRQPGPGLAAGRGGAAAWGGPALGASEPGGTWEVDSTPEVGAEPAREFFPGPCGQNPGCK